MYQDAHTTLDDLVETLVQDCEPLTDWESIFKRLLSAKYPRVYLENNRYRIIDRLLEYYQAENRRFQVRESVTYNTRRKHRSGNFFFRRLELSIQRAVSEQADLSSWQRVQAYLENHEPLESAEALEESKDFILNCLLRELHTTRGSEMHPEEFVEGLEFPLIEHDEDDSGFDTRIYPSRDSTPNSYVAVTVPNKSSDTYWATRARSPQVLSYVYCGHSLPWITKTWADFFVQTHGAKVVSGKLLIEWSEMLNPSQSVFDIVSTEEAAKRGVNGVEVDIGIPKKGWLRRTFHKT